MKALASQPWAIKLREAVVSAEMRRRGEIVARLKVRPTCAAVIALVEEYYGLRSGEIAGPGRFRHLIEARRMACQRIVTANKSQIGRALNRDHSTVCHHIAQSMGPRFNWADLASIEKMIAQVRAPEPVDNAHRPEKDSPRDSLLGHYDSR